MSTINPQDEFHLPDFDCSNVEEYGAGGLLGPEEMLQFWEVARPWFASRGLNLYETSDEIVNGTQYYRWLSHRELGDSPAPLPFATCVPSYNNLLQPARWIERFGYAHNSQHRDVVIKLVDRHSDHYRIFQRLLEDKTFLDPACFPCVLPPLAIHDTPYNFSFVAMPMWGRLDTTTILDMETVGEVLHFMRCTMQGLAFLHRHRIAHRDIVENNILVNYYRYDNDFLAHEQDLRAHRKTGNVCYALMDYNQSIILPAETCLRTCRRPADESLYGFGGYKPWDIALGEPTYNPFAYDVGMLGNFLVTYLTDVVRYVPACAALFDKMTTWVVPKRFTAEEALEFLNNATADLSKEVLAAPVSLEIIGHDNEHWEKLSPEAYKIWNRFKTPPVTWWSNVLEWFLQYKPTRYIIVTARRILNV